MPNPNCDRVSEVKDVVMSGTDAEYRKLLDEHPNAETAMDRLEADLERYDESFTGATR